MIGLGTIINIVAILAGGLIGLVGGKALQERHQRTVIAACGVSVIFIGAGGALSAMALTENSGLLLTLSLVLGALIGEILNIEGRIEQFGTWLRNKTGNSKDTRFVDAFMTATLTFAIGAMTVLGPINDALFGDYTILITKSILDGIMCLMLAGSMGAGAVFSAIPVGVIQGLFTVLAKAIQPALEANPAALGNLSLVGSVLITCVGINLVWPKQLRVANFLPAIVFAVLFAYIL